jgi:serine protease AprX
MARITINGIAFDPLKSPTVYTMAAQARPDVFQTKYVLVQTAEPLTPQQRDELNKLDITILEYVPENTYVGVSRQGRANLPAIRDLPFVSWAGAYLESFKVAPSLIGNLKGAVTANLSGLPPATTQSKDRVTVDVVLHKGVGSDAARAEIAAAAGLDPQDLKVGRDKVRVTVERRQLERLAEIDDVRHIEPYLKPQLMNDVARGILDVDTVQAGGNLAGEGQTIAVADTGFDKGVTNDVHPAFTGRVVKLYPLGRATASDTDGHGTHVCGSALADGIMQGGTVIRGTAPKAKLIVQSLLDADGSLGGLPADLHDLFIVPYRDDGVRIHTNSWGSAAQGVYDSSASEVDDFVWTNRDCVICFAAGNNGRDSQSRGVVDPGSIGSPGVAKNCITVGATENLRPNFVFQGATSPSTYGDGWPNDFPTDPIHTDLVANNPAGMAAFSSRGPSTNSRIRPDVVAPGTAILSTRGRVATGAVWSQSPDPLYSYEGGTSMATPLVAGCAAVVREFLQSKGIASPSCALVKAMLINGAQVIAGQYLPPEVGAPPDISQGFGRVDLAATVGPFAAGITVTWKDEATSLETGGEKHFMQTLGPAQGVKATLVWTDLAGEALQNDLDLVVTMPNGEVYHGNMPAGSSAFDRTNNVEQVFAAAGGAGDVDIAVRCFRSIAPQSYALVVRTL